MTEHFFGIYELDSAGTILYSRSHEDAQPPPSIVGTNFFEEIEPFENADRLRSGIKSFMSGRQSVGSFFFEGIFEESRIKAKILLTRGHETQDDSVSGIVIMDIKNTENI